MSENVNANEPTHLEIDYPDRKLNRLTTFFRPIVAIPILVVFGLLSGAPLVWGFGFWQFEWPIIPAYVVVPTALMIVFRSKYPKWWFDWNLNLTRFATRVFSYLSLLTDVYPATDDSQAVDLDLYYPNASKELLSWLPLVKWFLSLPHFFLLFFLNTASSMVIVLAWFFILFTGRYPKKLFNFVVEVFHWNLRVVAYAFLLVTDRYPPFSFDGWNGGESERISGGRK